MISIFGLKLLYKLPGVVAYCALLSAIEKGLVAGFSGSKDDGYELVVGCCCCCGCGCGVTMLK